MMDLQSYKGVMVRKDYGSDKSIVKECLRNYAGLQLTPDSTVLDLGAHVGGFATMCARAGVRRYMGYEPDEENFLVLGANSPRHYELRRSAVSVSSDRELTFYIRPSKQSKCSSTICPSRPDSRMVRVVVPNEHVDDVVASWCPSVLKMDIEGAEQGILRHWGNRIPSCVKELAMEIHSHSYISHYEEDIHPLILRDFDLVYSCPSHGFKGPGKDWRHFEHSCSSNLFGFDLIYRRH